MKDSDTTNNGAAQDADASKRKRPDEQEDWKLKRGAKELSVEFGFAPTQPIFLSGRKEYDTTGRKFVLSSFRFGRVVGTAKGITYEYLFEMIPVSFALKNEVADPQASENKKLSTLRQSTYGFGFEPAGFRFIFLPSKRLKPYVQTGAGFIFTSKPIPVPQSLRYNFIGDFGGGIMYSLGRRRALNFGYRYFHISNMNIGVINPGYNANVFYANFSVFDK